MDRSSGKRSRPTESNGSQESNKRDSPSKPTKNGLQCENGAMNLLDDGPLHVINSRLNGSTRTLKPSARMRATGTSSLRLPTSLDIHKNNSLTELSHKCSPGVDVKQSCCKELLVASNNVVVGFDSDELLLCDENLATLLPGHKAPRSFAAFRESKLINTP